MESLISFEKLVINNAPNVKKKKNDFPSFISKVINKGTSSKNISSYVLEYIIIAFIF